MGWTSYHAKFFKNGKIDRKTECDSQFCEHYTVLKSSMVGNTYYAAVRIDKENEPPTVFCAITLTSVNNNSYFNFSYKDMDETYGVFSCCDCPKSILDLLTPTDNKWANEWRELCRKNLEKKHNPNSLRNLKENSVVRIVMPFDTQLRNKGDEVVLTKKKYGKTCKWFAGGCYFTSPLMKKLEDYEYEIVTKG